MGKNKLFKIIISVELLVIIIFFVGYLISSLRGEPISHNYKINIEDSSIWKLVFNDEFEDSTLDLTKFKIIDFEENNHLRRAGYYSKENVLVENGNLIIRTNYQTNGKYGSGWYTGWVETSKVVSKSYETLGYNGFNAKGGYFEIKAIVPETTGIWAAFWMMPDNNIYGSESETLDSALDGAEIDIMESPYNYLGGIMKEKVTPVVHADELDSTTKYSDNHIKTTDANNITHYSYLKSYNGKNYYVPKMYSSYHTYGVEWNVNEDQSKSYIKFYIDGYLTFTVGESWAVKQLKKSIDMLIPSVFEYLILSVEVGGTSQNGVVTPGAWCGNPDSNDKSKSYDYIVDYLRVYQRV